MEETAYEVSFDEDSAGGSSTWMSNCQRSTTSLVSRFMMIKASESSLPARIQAIVRNEGGEKERVSEFAVQWLQDSVRHPPRSPSASTSFVTSYRRTAREILPQGFQASEQQNCERRENSPWTCFITFCTYFSNASSALVNNVKPYFLTCLKSSGG